ncbi:hypothetical protein VYU27_006977 [Nannochloropsis oceanica]
MGAQFYSTNFAASTWTSFVGRQRDFVQFWLQDHGLASQEVKSNSNGNSTSNSSSNSNSSSSSSCCSSSNSNSNSNNGTNTSTSTSTSTSSSRMGEDGEGACGAGPLMAIPENVRSFINEERRLLKLEGSACLDVKNKTSVEGLFLPYLYHILHGYHQRHLEVQ